MSKKLGIIAVILLIITTYVAYQNGEAYKEAVEYLKKEQAREIATKEEFQEKVDNLATLEADTNDNLAKKETALTSLTETNDEITQVTNATFGKCRGDPPATYH